MSGNTTTTGRLDDRGRLPGDGAVGGGRDGAIAAKRDVEDEHVSAARAEVSAARAADGADAVLAPAGHAVEGQPITVYRAGDRVERSRA